MAKLRSIAVRFLKNTEGAKTLKQNNQTDKVTRSADGTGKSGNVLIAPIMPDHDGIHSIYKLLLHAARHACPFS
jgi:hypothetical protein